MALTVDEIQSRIASRVDQDEDTGNISEDDYSLRLKYINMALNEWAETSTWQTLYSEFNVLVSTASNNASISLPANFRRLASYPRINVDNYPIDFPENLNPNEYLYRDTDYRVRVLGNPQDGYFLRVFGTALASGATVTVPYYKSPQSLASPANVAEIPNADYLVQRTVAQIWETREDNRFPQAKADADRILANLIEFEQTSSVASDDRIKTYEETHYGSFRLGQD